MGLWKIWKLSLFLWASTYVVDLSLSFSLYFFWLLSKNLVFADQIIFQLQSVKTNFSVVRWLNYIILYICLALLSCYLISRMWNIHCEPQFYSDKIIMPQLTCCNKVKETSYLRDAKTSNKIRGINEIWMFFPSIDKEGTMYKNKSEQPTVFSGFTFLLARRFGSCRRKWRMHKVNYLLLNVAK